jgi:hypothetical protein
VNELSQALQDLPLAALIPVALLVIVGLMLWAAGRRLLRVSFAATGLVLGGVAGWLIGEAFGLAFPWIPALIGAVVLAALAAVLYRATMAAATAVILAVAAPLAVLTVAEASPQIEVSAQRADDEGAVDTPPTDAPPQPSEPDDIEQWLREKVREGAREHAEGLAVDSSQALAERLPPDVAAQYDRLKEYFARLWNGLRQTWAETSPALRPYLAGSAILGAALGMFIGILAPGVTASIVTAFGGSLLWLGGARVLGEHFALTEASWLPGRGMTWLLLWIVVALIGFAIQWRFRAVKADK